MSPEVLLFAEFHDQEGNLLIEVNPEKVCWTGTCVCVCVCYYADIKFHGFLECTFNSSFCFVCTVCVNFYAIDVLFTAIMILCWYVVNLNLVSAILTLVVLITLLQEGMWSNVERCVVCGSARISKTKRANLTKSSIRVTCGCSLIRLWRWCSVLCIFGFCGRRHFFTSENHRGHSKAYTESCIG